jgi:hypothetical protein
MRLWSPGEMVARHAKPDSAGRYCNTACGTQMAMRAYRRRLKRKWGSQDDADRGGRPACATPK